MSKRQSLSTTVLFRTTLAYVHSDDHTQPISLFLDKIFTVLDGTPSEDDHVFFNDGAQMYRMVEQRPVTLEGIYLITPFHTQFFSPDPPPPHFKAPNATSPKPPPGTQTHGTVRFLCIEKKNHAGSKEAKCLTIT